MFGDIILCHEHEAVFAFYFTVLLNRDKKGLLINIQSPNSAIKPTFQAPT